MKDIPEQQQKDYEAYLQRHLKTHLVNINRGRLNNITDITIKKNKCISQCYKKNYTNNRVEDNELGDVIDNIR